MILNLSNIIYVDKNIKIQIKSKFEIVNFLYIYMYIPIRGIQTVHCGSKGCRECWSKGTSHRSTEEEKQ